jgi:hypothetical protein
MTAIKTSIAIADSRASDIVAEAVPYNEQLDRNKEWAMDEGGKFFEGTSKTHLALHKIAKRLGEIGVDYVVVDGMAMFQHGYRRFTEDVDLLVTREGLEEVHRALEGLGYRPPFQNSKHLRDTEYGIKIEFLVTGEFPGDGKPKPVAFPAPAAVADEFDGIRYINLATLIELKLASGMTNRDRRKDLVDVMEMIKVLDLPITFAGRLNTFVQEEYRRLWEDAHPAGKQFIKLWPKAQSVAGMLADGVTIDATRETAEDYVYLVTTDPVVAKKYDMHDEAEFM